MENQLIKIEVKNDQQLVSARDLHKALGFKSRFSRWVDQNFSHFEEGIDYTSVQGCTVVNNGAKRELQDYWITLDMAKELCMMSYTDKGKEVRKYFIQAEKNWNSPDMVMKRAMSILNARIEKLESKNLQLTTQLEEATEKTNYLDMILATKDNLAVTQIAKDYGYGAVDFNKLLHKYGVQYKVNDQWVLYDAFADKKYTVTRTVTFTRKNGQLGSKNHTYWTQAGRMMIYKVLKKNGILPLIERKDAI